MSNTPDSIFAALQEGMELGPEHHRFRLIKFNGSHLLGQLWQAEDIATAGSPLVTLLIITPALLKQASFAEGIKQHAAQCKQLNNKHIAECYGFFSHRGGLLFLSYEKLDGMTLATLLRKGSQLQSNQQLGLIRQIAYAVDMGYQKLHMAHACLSPDTIFVNRSGGAKLTLFALRDSLEAIEPLLETPPGYRQYQPPEAFHPGKLSRKADVYAFAAILYEILTGKAPFSLQDGEAERVRKTLEQPAQLDETQWQTLQQAFATTPEQRFPNCSELVKALYPAQQEKPAADTEEAASPDDSSVEITTAGDETAPDPAAGQAATQTPSSEAVPEETSAEPSARKFSLRQINLPKPLLYSLAGSILFIAGYLLGWFISDFINFKERDFLKLQVSKQQEALQQMYDALQAQQSLQTNREEQLQDLTLNNKLLQQQLTAAKKQLADKEPETPGNQIFKDQIDTYNYGPEMVLLPSGDFRMGDQAGLGDDNERPVHIVHIEKPFALSRFEVTFAEYDAFAKATNRPLPDDQGWGRGNQPVINVSWLDAVEYASWLREQTGQAYRLPTEAEWEYAARAGTRSPYWWGDELKPDMAVCADCGSRWDGQQPAPVGSFPANPWGLHDMTGNVDEWVLDCYADSYQNAPVDGSAYREQACKDRVMRGGSWFEIERLIRPASRYRHPLDSKRNSWGFRVALDMD